jgi:propionyl-CoA synthetase
VTNTCHNALDRHVAGGRGEQAAIIYDSPVTGETRRISYREMLADVTALAGVLAELGVGKGDRVVIYMPMIPEALAAMYASARLGAVHSVVFGGFASRELAARIEDARPKVVLTASCGIENEPGDRLQAVARRGAPPLEHKVESCLVFQRPQLAADSRRAAISTGPRRSLAPRPRALGRPACRSPPRIRSTSSTRRARRAGRRAWCVTPGGHLVAPLWSMRTSTASRLARFSGRPPTSVGRRPHLHCLCAALSWCDERPLRGEASRHADAGAFWRVCEQHGVVTLFTAPTALRAIRKEDPEGRFVRERDMSRFRALFLAGERADPDTVAWARGSSGSRSSTIGGRPRPGGRSPATRSASGSCP